MALQPHWLDEVVGENKIADDVIKAISSSADFKRLVQTAVKKGLDSEEAHKKDPRIVGPDYAQTVRAAIQRGFEQNELDLGNL